MHPETTTEADVERVLSAHVGRRVRVLGAEPLGGEWAPMARLTLDTAVGGIGPTVVVKRRRHGGAGWGYDPTNLRNEAAALRFLADLDAGVAARVIAADDDAGILVMTDLGAGPSVEALVHGDDPAAARKALVAQARTIGIMHAATRGKEDAYYAHRIVLGSAAPADQADARLWLYTSPFDRWDELCAAAAACGFPRPAPATVDLTTLVGELRQPGPLLALTQLDLTPSNAVLTGDGAALVDFESAGVRHLGLDAGLLRFPFPHYGRWATVPDAVIDDMLRAYRDTLARSWPMDDGAFADLLAIGCAVWAVVRTYRLPKLCDQHQSSAEAHRRRTQLLHTIQTCVTTAERAQRFPDLVAWFADVAAEIRRRWPSACAPPPRFPAFV